MDSKESRQQQKKNAIKYNRNDTNGMMDKLNITVKEFVGILVIVGGIMANYFIVSNQATTNTDKIDMLTRKIEHLEAKEQALQLTTNTLISDVKYIKEQTNQIYQIVVLNNLSN